MQFPLIKCAKCNKAVSEMRFNELVDGTGWQIQVFCHGEKDEMVLRPSHDPSEHKALEEALSRGGVAFLKPVELLA